MNKYKQEPKNLDKDEIVIFENQNIKLNVNMKDETVWLTHQQMAKLFDRDIATISKHIINAFKEEVEEKASNFLYLITKNHVFIAQSNPKEKIILADLVIKFLNQ